jgi:enoyl-CoA hydratase
MTQRALQIGDSAELYLTVAPQHTIRLGGIEVFATPQMINLMEHAAREVLRPILDVGAESVGADVNVRHLAPTKIGGRVVAKATVTNINEKLIDFAVEAHDDDGKIGEGTHRRALISLEKFASKIQSPNDVPHGTPLPNFQTLLVEVRDAIAYVTLNRPQKLNTITRQMTQELKTLCAWLKAHLREVRVVILTGAGRAFCAGDDVREVRDLPIEEAESLSLKQGRLFVGFEEIPQPIIAAVNGYALGGGCVMAYSCDFRIASQAARFGMPEIVLGWPPGWGVSQLMAIVGKARALELCLTGKQISANTAKEWGLVNEVVPANRLMEAAESLAQTLLAQPPIALRETKRLLHADEGAWPKQTYQQDTAAYIRCLQSADAREGINAFLEKRAGRFRDE